MALNEHISRRANKEDGCTGAFLEGRFKCIRIEDEAGLVARSVYIDLNPVRAKLAQTPEQSAFTGIQERALSVKKSQEISETRQSFWHFRNTFRNTPVTFLFPIYG